MYIINITIITKGPRRINPPRILRNPFIPLRSLYHSCIQFLSLSGVTISAAPAFRPVIGFPSYISMYIFYVQYTRHSYYVLWCVCGCFFALFFFFSFFFSQREIKFHGTKCFVRPVCIVMRVIEHRRVVNSNVCDLEEKNIKYSNLYRVYGLFYLPLFSLARIDGAQSIRNDCMNFFFVGLMFIYVHEEKKKKKKDIQVDNFRQCFLNGKNKNEFANTTTFFPLLFEQTLRTDKIRWLGRNSFSQPRCFPRIQTF